MIHSASCFCSARHQTDENKKAQKITEPLTSLPPLTDKQLLEAYRWNYIYGAEWGGGGLGSDLIHEGLKVWERKRVSSTSDPESFTWRTRSSLCISACLCLFLVCWQLLVHLRFVICLSARFHHFCLCWADPFVPLFFVSKPVSLRYLWIMSRPMWASFTFLQLYTLLCFFLFIIRIFQGCMLCGAGLDTNTEMLQSTEWKHAVANQSLSCLWSQWCCSSLILQS